LLTGELWGQTDGDPAPSSRRNERTDARHTLVDARQVPLRRHGDRQPWSIPSDVRSRDHFLRNYWVNTSSNDPVRDMLGRHALAIEPEIETLREGLAQIRDRDYLAELCATGSSPVHAFAVAFDGKRVWVRSAGEAEKRGKAKKKRPPAVKRAKAGK
jgi:hypothetical protein